MAPLDSASFKKTTSLPPRHRNGSADLTHGPTTTPSTAAGISVIKPVKSASMRTKSNLDYEDPFEAHLEDIYAGRATIEDGLKFFETHGYYDIQDANTVAMFRQNFGMKKQFWDGAEHDLVFYEEINLDTVDLAGLQVLNAGAMLSKSVTRQRTMSGRFQLLDDDGNEIDPEAQLEAEREKRLKLRHLELDDDDKADLAQAELTLAVAITVIRTEKTRFQRYFFDSCKEEVVQPAVTIPVIPQPAPVVDVELPSYSGYLYVLKDTIPHLFRSWHKRWVYLDINKGVANMYKRSYWKSPRGSLDLRTVINITRMNQSDICLQCFDGRSVLFRSKTGSSDADLWLSLLQVARRQVGGSSPAVPQLPPSTTQTSLTQLTKTTTTTTMTTVSTGPSALLVSTTLGPQDEKNILEMLLQTKTATNAITAA